MLLRPEKTLRPERLVTRFHRGERAGDALTHLARGALAFLAIFFQQHVDRNRLGLEAADQRDVVFEIEFFHG